MIWEISVTRHLQEGGEIHQYERMITQREYTDSCRQTSRLRSKRVGARGIVSVSDAGWGFGGDAASASGAGAGAGGASQASMAASVRSSHFSKWSSSLCSSSVLDMSYRHSGRWGQVNC